jgi:hypothetical protein
MDAFPVAPFLNVLGSASLFGNPPTFCRNLSLAFLLAASIILVATNLDYLFIDLAPIQSVNKKSELIIRLLPIQPDEYSLFFKELVWFVLMFQSNHRYRYSIQSGFSFFLI